MEQKTITGIIQIATAGHHRWDTAAHLALCNDSSLWIRYSGVEVAKLKISPEWEKLESDLSDIAQISIAYGDNQLVIDVLCKDGSVWTRRDKPDSFEQSTWECINKVK